MECDAELTTLQRETARPSNRSPNRFHGCTTTKAWSCCRRRARTSSGAAISAPGTRPSSRSTSGSRCSSTASRRKIKPFYMEPDADRPDLVLGCDLIAPEGYGELIGGGQRIHDPDLLERKLSEHGLPTEPYQWYLDLRRYGTVPHSGFGMGSGTAGRVGCWASSSARDHSVPSDGGSARTVTSFHAGAAHLQLLRAVDFLRPAPGTIGSAFALTRRFCPAARRSISRRCSCSAIILATLVLAPGRRRATATATR